MEELGSESIRSKALASDSAGQKWHFHILTPSCQFNLGKTYAFTLEVPEGNYICYSDSPPNELGKELAPLAHKASVLDKSSTEKDYQPTREMSKIIERAKELNSKGVEWHHHVTFKGCQFHTGDSNYAFVFEDPELGLTIIPNDEEPINDLKQIEPLFYSQHPKN